MQNGVPALQILGTCGVISVWYDLISHILLSYKIIILIEMIHFVVTSHKIPVW